MNRVVVLLARAPSARGKTRLTAGWPEPRARALRERLLLDTLTAARAAGYPLVVSFTPEEARDELRGLVGEAQLVAQRGDDLGTRMQYAMFDGFASGADAVVLIGSDLPTLPPRHIVDAFDMLEGVGLLTTEAPAKAVGPADLVFGPSEDGGFYLAGARGDVSGIFGNVEWGQSDVLARVTAAAHLAGMSVGFVREWWDVDAPEDLRRCRGYEEFSRDER
jgi:rSAM/selenodomain-associated transferase 1